MPLFAFPSFFFNDTATTEIYTLSLHDALPISSLGQHRPRSAGRAGHADARARAHRRVEAALARRSEEHTSELQSQSNLVCRLLLEKKNTTLNTSCCYAFTISYNPPKHYIRHYT